MKQDNLTGTDIKQMDDRDTAKKEPSTAEPITDEVTEEIIGEVTKEMSSQVISSMRATQMFSGPLPSPKIMKGYQEIDESLPLEILEMAKNQMKHRQDMERLVISGDIKLQGQGSIFGFIVCLIGMISGVGLLYFDKEIGGFGTILFSLGSVVYSFKRQKEKQNRENESKDTEMEENKPEEV